MAIRHVVYDSIKNKSYDYITESERDEHLFSVLKAATNNQCPPENIDYLCEKTDATDNQELLQCAECYRQWAAKVPGVTGAKATRLLQAIELATHDQCPPETADMICKATEDENTDEETCAMCIQRWATVPFAVFGK